MPHYSRKVFCLGCGLLILAAPCTVAEMGQTVTPTHPCWCEPHLHIHQEAPSPTAPTITPSWTAVSGTASYATNFWFSGKTGKT
jgi:hypothetical protein